MFLTKNDNKYKIIKILFIINLLGLVPFCWGVTCFFWGNFLIAIFFWFTSSLTKFFKKNKSFLGHLLPLGAPLPLWYLLIILEVVRHLIRPVTLSLRLTCNIIAGHVILSLVLFMKYSIIFVLVILAFEMCVRLIQSLVFFMLIHSYKEE